jgi:molecular chaperone HscA
VAGAARIRVTFQVDADGLLSVTAREQLSGVEVQVAVKPSYGLADGDITRMLQESFVHAAGDKDARALAEEQVDAQRLLESVRAAMAQDHTLLSAAEQQRIHDAMAQLSVTLQATDHQAIHAATQALSKATDDFAALRMDRSVHDALAGKRVEEL